MVLRLVRAMRNRVNTLDKKGTAYLNRWGRIENGMIVEYYKQEAMEKVCWDILVSC